MIEDIFELQCSCGKMTVSFGVQPDNTPKNVDEKICRTCHNVYTELSYTRNIING